MENKSPSKITRFMAVAMLLFFGVYALNFLFIDRAQPITRLKIIVWLVLFGLVGFFYNFFTKTGSEREKFWQEFINGKGFKSDLEHREHNKNTLILIILIIVGVLAVFFL